MKRTFRIPTVLTAVFFQLISLSSYCADKTPDDSYRALKQIETSNDVLWLEKSLIPLKKLRI
jgi:hypothetical protein